MAQIRIAPNTANELVIEPDETVVADFTKTHTGFSDFRYQVQAGLGLDSNALDEIWLEEDDGTLLFRGQLQKIDEQDKPPLTTISGPGPGYKLEQSETVFTVSNELAHNAIERFWNNETPFSPTVTTPSINNTITGESVQEANTTSEFNDIYSVADTDPINITNDEIQLLQAAFTQEGESGTSEDTLTNSNANYSDGTAEGFNDTGFIEWEFTVDYDIAEFAIHYRNDATGSDVPSISWFLDGDKIGETNTTLSLGWDEVYDVTGTTKPELSSGTYTVRAEPTALQFSETFTANHGTAVALSFDTIVNGSETVTTTDGATTFSRGTDYEMNYADGEITTLSSGNMTDGNDFDIEYDHLDFADSRFIDVIAPLDDTFSYTFDNDNGGSSGYLDGPEFFPDAFDVVFNSNSTSWNITDGTISSTWDDTTNNQRIQLRLASQTWFPNDGTENNTTSVTTDFGSEVGSSIQGRATLSRYGSTTGQTPLTGINGQHLQSWEITFDGNDRPVFEGESFEGTDLEVAQQLHQRADMRFTLEHEKSSLPVESYRPEDNVKSLPELDVINETTRTDYGSFANHITVRGQTEDGDRLSHTVQDDTSVNDIGEIHHDVIDPSLKSLVEIKVTARAILREKLRERDDKGEKEVTPIDIAPGYGRTSPFGGDDTPIEEVSYRISNGRLNGRLVFDFRTGMRLASDIGGLRNKGRNNSLGF